MRLSTLFLWLAALTLVAYSAGFWLTRPEQELRYVLIPGVGGEFLFAILPSHSEIRLWWADKDAPSMMSLIRVPFPRSKASLEARPIPTPTPTKHYYTREI